MRFEPVKYVKVGGSHIAYSTAGQAERDFCIILPSLGTIEVLKEQPALRIMEELCRHSRLISFDRRGAGLSDPVDVPATLEEQMDDVTAVLDAVGSDTTVLSAEVEGAMLAVMYAATYPERVSHLVLTHPMARMTAAPGYDWGWANAEEREREFTLPLLHRWGTGESASMASPVVSARDPSFKSWWGKWERLSASPGTMLKRQELVTQLDVREILPRVQAPTLILSRPGALFFDSRHAEYFAEHIPNGTHRPIRGRDAVSFGDGAEEWLEAVEEFTTGAIAVASAHRALATVLFTDICGSTEMAAKLGDRRWRQTLEQHDRMTRELVGVYGGKAIKSTGDGFLATFDGPARAVRCATTLGERIGELGIELRAGLHTGEVELIGADVGGMAVHIGARIGALGGAGEVLTSSTVRDLVVGSGIEFDERGEHELKGVPGSWKVFAASANEDD